MSIWQDKRSWSCKPKWR